MHVVALLSEYMYRGYINENKPLVLTSDSNNLVVYNCYRTQNLECVINILVHKNCENLNPKFHFDNIVRILNYEAEDNSELGSILDELGLAIHFLPDFTKNTTGHYELSYEF